MANIHHSAHNRAGIQQVFLDIMKAQKNDEMEVSWGLNDKDTLLSTIITVPSLLMGRDA